MMMNKESSSDKLVLKVPNNSIESRVLLNALRSIEFNNGLLFKIIVEKVIFPKRFSGK
jgi:hypothetical protein